MRIKNKLNNAFKNQYEYGVANGEYIALTWIEEQIRKGA